MDAVQNQSHSAHAFHNSNQSYQHAACFSDRNIFPFLHRHNTSVDGMSNSELPYWRCMASTDLSCGALTTSRTDNMTGCYNVSQVNHSVNDYTQHCTCAVPGEYIVVENTLEHCGVETPIIDDDIRGNKTLIYEDEWLEHRNRHGLSVYEPNQHYEECWQPVCTWKAPGKISSTLLLCVMKRK